MVSFEECSPCSKPFYIGGKVQINKVSVRGSSGMFAPPLCQSSGMPDIGIYWWADALYIKGCQPELGALVIYMFKRSLHVNIFNFIASPCPTVCGLNWAAQDLLFKIFFQEHVQLYFWTCCERFLNFNWQNVLRDLWRLEEIETLIGQSENLGRIVSLLVNPPLLHCPLFGKWKFMKWK